MREELRDPLRLDHIKDAIERLIEFDKSCTLEDIGGKRPTILWCCEAFRDYWRSCI